MTLQAPPAPGLRRAATLGSRLEHGWRVAATVFCFAAFGIGGLLLWGLVFPLLTSPLLLTLTGRARRRAAAQAVIHASLRTLVGLMTGLGIIRLDIRGLDRLQGRGQLILANHPTLIDVVLLMAFVRHTDCIVKGALAHNPFTRLPIRATGFVCNNSGAGLIEDCIASVRAGNNLIIFPEGTRTPRHLNPGSMTNNCTNNYTDSDANGVNVAPAAPRLQRGAAQIAIRGGVDITPVRIRCEPPMLVKGEPWWHVPAQRSHFTLEVGDDIAVSPFLKAAPASMPSPDEPASGEARSARRLTEFLSSYFFQEIPRAST